MRNRHSEQVSDNWTPEGSLHFSPLLEMQAPPQDSALDHQWISFDVLDHFMDRVQESGLFQSQSEPDFQIDLKMTSEAETVAAALIEANAYTKQLEDVRAALVELALVPVRSSSDGEALQRVLANPSQEEISKTYDVQSDAQLELLELAFSRLAETTEPSEISKNTLIEGIETIDKALASFLDTGLATHKQHAAERLVFGLRRALEIDEARSRVVLTDNEKFVTDLQTANGKGDLAKFEEHERGTHGGKPTSLFVVAAPITTTDCDLRMLKTCLGFAARHRVPIALTVSAEVFGLESFSDLDEVDDVPGYLRTHQHDAIWKMRQHVGAKFVALVAQETPARARLVPKEGQQLQWAYREDPNAKPVWIGGALSLVRNAQQACLRTGWVGDMISQTEAGAQRSFVDTLHRVQIGKPVRHVYSEETARGLAQFGLVPLRSVDGQLHFDAMPTAYVPPDALPSLFEFAEVLAQHQFETLLHGLVRDYSWYAEDLHSVLKDITEMYFSAEIEGAIAQIHSIARQQDPMTIQPGITTINVEYTPRVTLEPEPARVVFPLTF